MIELERHIEVLLLDNDCVIVPGLGGFVAHYVEARYDDKEGLFLPPLRAIGFNPKLNLNDSLLAQSYAEAYDISYPEAMSRIESDVNELINILGKERQYNLSSIGTLSLNDSGTYDFMPCEAGLLTPELYGLYSFGMDIISHEIPSVSDDIQEDDLPIEKIQDECDDEEDSDKIISIRVSWIRNIVAAAIAIFAFFVISPPIGDRDSEKAMFNFDESLLFRFIPKDVTIPVKTVDDVKQKPVIANVVNKDSVTTVNEDIAKKEKTDTVTKKEEAYYTIVLASKVAERNANDYVNKLHKSGVSDVFVHKSKSNIVRVLCGHYKTEGEAYAALNAQGSDDVFSQGWIYRVEE